MDELVRDAFLDHGYIALFVLMLLDNVGVPLPSEIPLLGGGFLVSEGRMDYVPAVVIATVGSVAGALAAYALGRSLGRAVILRFGRVLSVKPSDVDRAEAWFAQRGEPAVFVCRMIPLARTFISIPAGILEMDLRRFTVYTTAGSAIWCVALIAAGWGLGSSYEDVLEEFSLASVIAGAVIATVLTVVVIRWVAARSRRRS